MSGRAVVYVIDDDKDVRQALTFLLGAAGLFVQVYESASAFLKVARNLEPGCIVTDVRMPGLDGLQLLEILREQRSTAPVIVMTGHGDISLAVQAMKAGAVDFIEKPFDNDALLSAISSVLARQDGDNCRKKRAEDVRGRIRRLSQRERQVLDGLIAGKSNKVIAHDLDLSARTVEGYRASLMTKMEAARLSDLIRMVLAPS